MGGSCTPIPFVSNMLFLWVMCWGTKEGSWAGAQKLAFRMRAYRQLEAAGCTAHGRIEMESYASYVRELNNGVGPLERRSTASFSKPASRTATRANNVGKRCFVHS